MRDNAVNSAIFGGIALAIVVGAGALIGIPTAFLVFVAAAVAWISGVFAGSDRDDWYLHE